MPRLSGKVGIIAVGKLRRPYWKSAQKVYERRILRYTDFQMVEVRASVGQGPPDNVAVQREGEQLLLAAKPYSRKVALSPIGVQMNSLKLSEYLQRQVQIFRSICFLIGGPAGISDEALAECHDQISLSPLTFPHELARILLMEQIFRAATIIAGDPYHK